MITQLKGSSTDFQENLFGSISWTIVTMMETETTYKYC